MKVIITIEAEIDELEATCFNANMTDEDLDGQADLVKDIMRMGYFSRHGVNRNKVREQNMVQSETLITALFIILLIGWIT
jgi:hypothetical protein